jgi:hypothetical protein
VTALRQDVRAPSALGLQRLALAFSRNMVEDDTGLYFVRLFAFLLILGAILDKNRSSPQPPPG